MPVAAFKLGMLGSAEAVTVIATILSDYPDIPLVLDPVLASGRGDTLADEEQIEAMSDRLLPQTTLITPNSLEARRLTTGEHDDEEGPSLAECARRLIGTGCEYVLITGTHENTVEVENVLYAESGVVRSDRWARLAGSYHGSGCTLASAIAAGLAHGLDIGEAVRDAQDFTWQALAAGFRPGMGQFLPDRLFWAREIAQEQTDA
jgi:hydroxymethylpyrimidine/phosphomethylpyrimidine kinase